MLRNAITHAESSDVSSEKVSEARVLLARLEEDEAAARHAEAVRLEAEAAALDAALAAEDSGAKSHGGLSHSGTYSDDDDDLDDSRLSAAPSDHSPAPPAPRGGPNRYLSDSSIGSPAHASVLHFDGRKLASRSERARRESLTQEAVDPNEGRPEITDEQIDRVFHAYAKVTGTVSFPTLNVMQFSTIWRLITGVRGNLFQEMKILTSSMLTIMECSA